MPPVAVAVAAASKAYGVAARAVAEGLEAAEPLSAVMVAPVSAFAVSTVKPKDNAQKRA